MADILGFKEARKRPYLLVIGFATFGAIASLATSTILLVDALLSSPAPASSSMMGPAVFAVLALLLQASVVIYGWPKMMGGADLFGSAQAAKAQTDELFAMTDMLQSAEGYEDATAVLMATSLRLLPDLGASLYIFNNSRDRLDLAGSWNMPAEFQQGQSLGPSNCWALKRGKPHINDPSQGTLCCTHHKGAAATLEVPMMARGS